MTRTPDLYTTSHGSFITGLDVRDPVYDPFAWAADIVGWPLYQVDPTVGAIFGFLGAGLYWAITWDGAGVYVQRWQAAQENFFGGDSQPGVVPYDDKRVVLSGAGEVCVHYLEDTLWTDSVGQGFWCSSKFVIALTTASGGQFVVMDAAGNLGAVVSGIPSQPGFGAASPYLVFLNASQALYFPNVHYNFGPLGGSTQAILLTISGVTITATAVFNAFPSVKYISDQPLRCADDRFKMFYTTGSYPSYSQVVEDWTFTSTSSPLTLSNSVTSPTLLRYTAGSTHGREHRLHYSQGSSVQDPWYSFLLYDPSGRLYLAGLDLLDLGISYFQVYELPRSYWYDTSLSRPPGHYGPYQETLQYYAAYILPLEEEDIGPDGLVRHAGPILFQRVLNLDNANPPRFFEFEHPPAATKLKIADEISATAMLSSGAGPKGVPVARFPGSVDVVLGRTNGFGFIGWCAIKRPDLCVLPPEYAGPFEEKWRLTKWSSDPSGVLVGRDELQLESVGAPGVPGASLDETIIYDGVDDQIYLVDEMIGSGTITGLHTGDLVIVIHYVPPNVVTFWEELNVPASFNRLYGPTRARNTESFDGLYFPVMSVWNHTQVAGDPSSYTYSAESPYVCLVTLVYRSRVSSLSFRGTCQITEFNIEDDIPFEVPPACGVGPMPVYGGKADFTASFAINGVHSVGFAATHQTIQNFACGLPLAPASVSLFTHTGVVMLYEAEVSADARRYNYFVSQMRVGKIGATQTDLFWPVYYMNRDYQGTKIYHRSASATTSVEVSAFSPNFGYKVYDITPDDKPDGYLYCAAYELWTWEHVLLQFRKDVGGQPLAVLRGLPGAHPSIAYKSDTEIIVAFPSYSTPFVWDPTAGTLTNGTVIQTPAYDPRTLDIDVSPLGDIFLLNDAGYWSLGTSGVYGYDQGAADLPGVSTLRSLPQALAVTLKPGTRGECVATAGGQVYVNDHLGVISDYGALPYLYERVIGAAFYRLALGPPPALRQRQRDDSRNRQLSSRQKSNRQGPNNTYW